jgi:hypothetical protein
MPIAVARWRGLVNTSLRIASVAGKMSAAAAPIAARAAMSSALLRDSAAATEKAANATSPACSMRRRPSRSPRFPATSNSPAKTSEYASTTHCSAEVEADRSRLIVGSATLTIVLSTATSRMLRQSTARTHHRRSVRFSIRVRLASGGVRWRRIIDVIEPCRVTGYLYAEEGADHLGNEGMVVSLGQAGYGDRSDNAHVLDADRKGAAVRREQPRFDSQCLVQCCPACR